MRICSRRTIRPLQTIPVPSCSWRGFFVDHRATGPDVWAEGETGDYAAIILDLGLPGMDGLSILKRWRSPAWTHRSSC